jgi:nicotinamide-nucleotide amidase
MLDGALEKSLADVGLAVSGIAGPTSDSSKQKVGTIWAAIRERGGPVYAFTLQITGDRQTIILKTAYSLFGILWRKLAKDIAPTD